MADVNRVQHPGGGEVVSQGSVSDFFYNFNQRVSDHKARGQGVQTEMVSVKNSIDRQRRLPLYMQSDEPHAIDGSKLSKEARESSYLGRYKLEMEAASAVAKHREQSRYELFNSATGTWNKARRSLGLMEPLQLDARAVEQSIREKWNAEVDSMEEIQRRGGASSKREMTWNNIMEDVSQRKPLSKMAKAYRPRVDVYGVDAFLDSGPSVIVGSTKWALIVGSIAGGIKGTRGLITEMGTVLSSGFSFMVMANFITFATAIKYGTLAFIASSGFVFGDRAAYAVKRLTYKERALAERRSTSNYVMGFACSLAPVGFTPYWFFSDVRLGARYALTGAFVGGLTGLLVSRVVDRLSSVNLQRINATDRQLRRYEALMRRQKDWFELESQRRIEINSDASLASGNGTIPSGV